MDRLILHELQLDGRLTNAALALRANLSESACLRRVRRLEGVGLIRGYVGLVDQSSAGYPDNVFVRITLTSQQQDDLKKFETAGHTPLHRLLPWTWLRSRIILKNQEPRRPAHSS